MIGKETSMKQTASKVTFLLALRFNPEDGGNMFLRIVGWLPTG
jgi:hypothetical protein